MPGQLARKEALRTLLAKRSFESYHDWYAAATAPLRTLHSMLFETDDLIRWRTIEALGVLAPPISKIDHEGLLTFIRKLFWAMNDESGMLCRTAPEAIAEILYHLPNLRDTFLPNLLTFTLEEPFEAGVCRGIIRLNNAPDLTPEEQQLLSDTTNDLKKLLACDSTDIQLWATAALYSLGLTEADLALRDRSLQMYDFATGQLKKQTPDDFRH